MIRKYGQSIDSLVLTLKVSFNNGKNLVNSDFFSSRPAGLLSPGFKYWFCFDSLFGGFLICACVFCFVFDVVSTSDLQSEFFLSLFIKSVSMIRTHEDYEHLLG